MKKKTLRFVLSGVVCAIAGAIIGVLYRFTAHVTDAMLRNELAVKQMENTADSSLLYEEYRQAVNMVNMFPLYVTLVIIIALSAIGLIFLFMGEKKKGITS